MANSAQDEDAAMAAADKELEERANRAKAILSARYSGLRKEQVCLANIVFVVCLDVIVCDNVTDSVK